jgi:hypothetical protein
MKLADILQIEESAFAKQFRHVVNVIDGLHRFPALPSFPIVLTRARREFGSYRHRVRPPRPIKIEVSKLANSPALTLVHEAGHFIDHLVLNPIKQGFGSEHDPMFDLLRAFRRGSKPVAYFARLLAQSRYSSQARAFVRYQSAVPELWARTYVQWVVMKSEDLLLEAFFQNIIPPPDFIGVRGSIYWENDEAKRMMELVNGVFSTAGLL